MSIGEHLRELRSRLVRSLIALSVGGVVGWIYFKPILTFLTEPICTAKTNGPAGGGECNTLYVGGILGPFSLQLKISLALGVLLSSPVWLYQLWAFITPGLHRQERRWAIGVVAAGVPLFTSGAWMGYLVLPRAVRILLNFTPATLGNLVTIDEYLDFAIRLLLVFGFAFLLPLFVVLLNVVGMVSARRLASSGRYVIFGIFVFAAIATPTPDPLTMITVAIPMCVLYALSVGVAWLVDRRRARRDRGTDQWSDDELSPIDEP
jgi:sec-independent protein translocase protein TatC